MAEFTKKTMVGYKPVAGGQSDPECTHVILSKIEYEKIVREKDLAFRKVEETQREASSQVVRAQEDARQLIRQEREAADAEINKANQVVAVANDEIKYLKGLNENLLRISRERANADRKLKPKKDHTGYVVASSSEKEHRYKVSRSEWATVMLWETVLQSPYSIDYTEEQARKLTGELTEKDAKGIWMIARIGINASCIGEYEDMLEQSGWDDEQIDAHNIILTRRLRANYRTGYWEIIFTHTKPLGIVPADMRVR